MTALMLLGAVDAQSNQTTTTQPGVTIDEHGCITSAGFVYCALREKCIRPWEEQCNDGRIVPLNGTNTTTTTLKPKPTTTTIIVNITTPTTVVTSPSSSTSSSETTLISPPTTQPIPILISEQNNTTNETTTSTTIESTTTTIETPTTLPPETIPTTTLAPECGNLYQEVGEECDTTASACGAGRWQCVDCKCVPLPDETTTTTTLQKSELEKLSSVMPKSISPEYIIGGIVLIILAVIAIAWIFGKEDDKQPGK